MSRETSNDRLINLSYRSVQKRTLMDRLLIKLPQSLPCHSSRYFFVSGFAIACILIAMIYYIIKKKNVKNHLLPSESLNPTATTGSSGLTSAKDSGEHS